MTVCRGWLASLYPLHSDTVPTGLKQPYLFCSGLYLRPLSTKLPIFPLPPLFPSLHHEGNILPTSTSHFFYRSFSFIEEFLIIQYFQRVSVQLLLLSWLPPLVREWEILDSSCIGVHAHTSTHFQRTTRISKQAWWVTSYSCKSADDCKHRGFESRRLRQPLIPAEQSVDL